ncbi:hypothetical protein HYW19_02190 [Candidatus Woesearchaeota archaeon]|nr:hypothetical protein [Candidatus Woesearchaeota archaeon]
MENNKEIEEKNAPKNNDDGVIKKSDAPACCVGCVRWEKFGKSCYYYWEGKKHCTMWIGSWDDAMQQPL